MRRGDVELREVVAALRSSWWLSVTALIVGAGVAFGLSLATTPVYTSSTQLFFSTANSSTI
jgi:uncharacterized protein involved in exopolysaccharide biosynthesis